MTGGGLESTTQVAAMIQFIFEEYGVHFNDLTKAQVAKAIDDPDIPEPVKDLLRVRQQASSSSTAKYKALLNRANDDDRFRGGIQFAGASRTRRAGGRGFQPQNLPSRDLLPDGLIEHGIELMKCDAEDLVFPNVMHLASSAIRRVLIAAPGKKFCISDLSAIEGRKAAWYGGETWALEAFRQYDTYKLDAHGNKIPDEKGEDYLRMGPDLYVATYAQAFQVPMDTVDKPKRNIGKVMTLMLGYSGGVGAFVTGANSYKFDLEKLANNIYDTLPPDLIREAEEFLEWWKSQGKTTYGLTDKAFVTVEVLKRLWRQSNARIVQLWSDIKFAAENTVVTKEPHEVGLLRFDMKGRWLRIRLASGRFLCYPFAEFDAEKGLSYYGVDQYTRKWQRIRTYNGKLFENICQSSARDVLYDSMPIAEAAGFPIVLHVHDELVTETEQDKHVEELSAIMAAGHPWTEGLPLAAAGFESLRYKK
jgi:DNA polymerase